MRKDASATSDDSGDLDETIQMNLADIAEIVGHREVAYPNVDIRADLLVFYELLVVDLVTQRLTCEGFEDNFLGSFIEYF